MIPIADLHCDLLCYLENDRKRTAWDPAARCAIPQLKAGNVKWQTCAVFTHTDSHSVRKGMAQIELFQSLPAHYPHDVYLYQNGPSSENCTALLYAFENASGFCNELEPVGNGFDRLKSIIDRVGKPLYISLTWNEENRFGGGALTKIGLREDGKRLLELMHERTITADLSHASDFLAYEIINYMENKGLHFPLIASHSNARPVFFAPRNLPADIAKEIFRREGVVGFNLYAPFLGESEESILDHIAFWLNLGGEKHLCLGTDFFYEADFPALKRKGEPFFKAYANASSYQDLLAFISDELKLKDRVINLLAYENFLNFIKKNEMS
ncbi:MAG: membrane dipeptidase [Candidatus Protochlamydia sp.]|nr:membrane dipeptidase [Candidatus Protochlamydia sp.]